MKGRPWLLPTVLCAISATLLLLLWALNAFRRPAVPQMEPLSTMAGVREENSALERRAAALRSLLDTGVCAENGSIRPRRGALTSDQATALPPPPPGETRVPPTSLPDDRAFSGTLVDLLRQATVLVLVATPDGALSAGSGFFVTPSTILTNRHVVGAAPGRHVKVFSRTIGAKDAEVLAESPEGPPGSPDFALLRVPDTAPVIPLTLGPPADLLLPVVAAGFPAMVLETNERFKRLLRGEGGDPPDLTVTTGIVGQVQQTNGTTTLLHQAQVTPGNSGGPLVDECGRVVGINTYIQAGNQGRWSYALGAADAVRFLATKGVAVRSATGPCSPVARGSENGGPGPDGGIREPDGGRREADGGGGRN